MNLRFAVVQKASQIEQWGVYIIRGTSSLKLPIPPQVFRIETKVLRASVVGRPYVRGTSWVNFGEHGKKEHYRELTNQILYLDAVGIYESGSSELTDYSRMAGISNPLDKDLHLERVPLSLQRALFGLDSGYHEVVQTSRNGAVII
jgi:hypothetical protein